MHFMIKRRTWMFVAILFIGLVPTSFKVHAQHSDSTVISEDFEDVLEGDLPKGWDGPDAVAVRKKGDVAWLEAATDGLHEVKTSKFALSGDFQCDMHALTDYGGKLRVTFTGHSGKGIVMEFDASTVGRIGTVPWTVQMDDAKKLINVSIQEPSHIRLIRKGHVFQLIVNDNVVIAMRLSPDGEFTRMCFQLTGPSDARGKSVTKLYDVTVKLTAEQ